MRAAEYDRFTNSLIETLAGDDRVIGLVALGSMADRTRTDEWSDHDFWVVTADGHAADLRTSDDWLPDRDDIVVRFVETAHGGSAIYRDGHLAEYAVFDDGELEIASANDYTVLFDRSDVGERLAAIVERTAQQHADAVSRWSLDDRFGVFLGQLVIGVNRAARGEMLSANQLIRSVAVRTLIELLVTCRVDPTDRALLDNLDPMRRIELVLPTAAGDIDAALARPVLDCADALLAVAERDLAPHVDAASDGTFAAVRELLDRARGR